MEFRKTDLSKDQTEEGQPICLMLSPLPQGRKGLEEGVLWERGREDAARTALLAEVKPQVPPVPPGLLSWPGAPSGSLENSFISICLPCNHPPQGPPARSSGWCSVQFSHSVSSNSLQPHGLQHARPPCPSPTPGACSDSCPSSR